MYHTSITKDSIVVAKAAYKRRKVQNGLPTCRVDVWHRAMYFLSFLFHDCTLSMIFVINKQITCMKIVPSKRQVLSSAKAYWVTWRHWKRCINTVHSDTVNKWSTFHTFTTTEVYGKPSPVDHLQIYILCPHRRAPLHRPMLILACLTGDSLSLIHIWRCRRIERCRSRWSPYH